jgi:RimJ/RimL family protein N-acetyltransferase
MSTTSTDALVTERLVLRRPRDSDLEGFALLCADTEVMRYIGTGRPLDRGTSERSFALIQAHWTRHGSGLRSAICREDGEYLGFVGLAVVPGRSVAGGETEIGWRLRRAAWGKGYATELGRALVGHAFSVLKVPRVVAQVEPANAASRRVLEKLGMTERGTRTAYGRPHLLYAVDAPRVVGTAV